MSFELDAIFGAGVVAEMPPLPEGGLELAFSTEPVEKPSPVNAVSELTRLVAELPEKRRTPAEFALTALDLFTDDEIVFLQRALTAGASARRTAQSAPYNHPLPVRGLPTEPTNRSTAWIGYDQPDPRWPGKQVSMVWMPVETMIATSALPPVVSGTGDVAKCLGATNAWVRARSCRASADGALAVLISACGTRAAAQLEGGWAWKLELL